MSLQFSSAARQSNTQKWNVCCKHFVKYAIVLMIVYLFIDERKCAKLQENLRILLTQMHIRAIFLGNVYEVLEARAGKTSQRQISTPADRWAMPKLFYHLRIHLERQFCICHSNSFGKCKAREVEPIKMDYWMQMLKIIIYDYFRMHYVYWASCMKNL